MAATTSSPARQARILEGWVEQLGFDPADYGTHSMRRTKATLIYRRTKNLRAVQLLLGHSKLESTVRYRGASRSTTPSRSPSKPRSEVLDGGRRQLSRWGGRLKGSYVVHGRTRSPGQEPDRHRAATVQSVASLVWLVSALDQLRRFMIRLKTLRAQG